MNRQRVQQIAVGYENCHDADYLRMDPALRLAIGKEQQAGAGRSRLSRLEKDLLDNTAGLTALEAALTRYTDALLRRKNKRGQRVDLDATEAPTLGKQDGVAPNGQVAKNCCHPLSGFTSEGDCLGARLRPGKVHAAAGALEFLRSCPEVVCPGGLRLSAGSTLPISAGLWSLSSTALKYLVSGGGVACPSFWKNYLFLAI
jgi:hypothetical protein